MGIIYAAGIIINDTDSTPTEFYRKVMKLPPKGDLVKVTTPRNELTKTHPIHEDLIKNIVTMEEEQVKIDGKGIHVNDAMLDKSEPVDFLEPTDVNKNSSTEK